MFQKKFRLPASVHLRNVEALHTSYFVIKIAKNNLSYNRYSFIVSKKVDKRAVVRNRLKRRFRAEVEHIQKETSSGFDFLYVLRKEAIEQTHETLRIELKTALLKKGLVKTQNKV